MQIQSFTPFTPRPLNKPEGSPPPPQDPDGPEDQMTFGQAALEVGKSGLRGAVEGVGYAYLAFVGDCVGPLAGLGVRLGLAGLGAAVGVKENGARLGERLGSPALGKTMAGVVGASKVLMMTGLSPAASLSGALLGGAVTGGLFGVLETPR